MDAQERCSHERESEFTGPKGALLRYTGCAFALILASQLIKAFALGPASAVGDVLLMVSRAVLVVAFIAYPIVAGIRRLMGRDLSTL